MGCCNASANNAEMMQGLEDAVDNKQSTNVPPVLDPNVGSAPYTPEKAKIQITVTKEPNSEKNTQKPEPEPVEDKTHNPKQNTTIIITPPQMHATPTPSDSNQTPQLTPADDGHHTPVASIDDRIDLRADETKIQHQIKMELQETEQKFQKDVQIHLRNETFNLQLQTLRTKDFETLYHVFERHAFGVNNDRMDSDRLFAALKEFGMVIVNKDLQQFVFKKFDPHFDDVTMIKELDYHDFSATMSAIVASNDKDALEILFQVFDLDQDGNLELEDIARVLLCLNQIAVVATGQQKKQTVTYTRTQCLKQAKRMIAKHNLDETKISFHEFSQMMKDKTEKDLMIESMPQVSVSYNAEAPRVSAMFG